MIKVALLTSSIEAAFEFTPSEAAWTSSEDPYFSIFSTWVTWEKMKKATPRFTVCRHRVSELKWSRWLFLHRSSKPQANSLFQKHQSPHPRPPKIEFLVQHLLQKIAKSRPQDLQFVVIEWVNWNNQSDSFYIVHRSRRRIHFSKSIKVLIQDPLKSSF